MAIAQWPNPILWIVIAAGALLRMGPSVGTLGFVLTVVFKGGLFVWAADEIARGANPWRRCLGAVVAAYEMVTLLT
ncbi:hypothetical protein ACWAUC_10665 [Bradyrhizobium guangdongense]